MRPVPLALVLALGASAFAATAHAQQPAADTVQQTLAVYLDCETSGCDFDFFRTELTMVNWVRDRQAADVHILVTTQPTGAGGREHVATFIGLRRFAGLTDTLKDVSEPAAAEDAHRRALAKKDFTPEEILTRSFQRGTGFRYCAFFGVSYTFGSIFNNVVNPRMGGGWFD